MEHACACHSVYWQVVDQDQETLRAAVHLIQVQSRRAQSHLTCHFAFCTNTLNNTFQSSIDAKLKELCDANGISYTCLDPDYDLNTQLSQLSDVANSGYDAVFIIPVDSAGITSGLAEIKDAGIPIFNVDTAVIEDDIENFVTQFVGTNAYMAGQLVGEQMAKDYPDGADIAILDFPSNESCVDRVNGFLDGLGDNKDKFKIVAQQDGEAAP